MRHAITAAILAGALLAVPAAAQVTVNPGALDLLPPAKKPAPSPPRPSPRRPVPAPQAGKTTPAAPDKQANKPPPPVANPNVPAGTAASIPKPALPTIPPAIAALPPPAPVPAPRPQPVPVVPLVADAKGSPTPIPGGVRVTFGADSSDFNPGTAAALRDLAEKLKSQDTTTINIYAYATGTPDDASTARRLSLARALAARAVLINAGVPSTRIYPRALGSAGGETDKDRVDVMAGAPGPPSSIAPPVLPANAPVPNPPSPTSNPASSPAPPAK